MLQYTNMQVPGSMLGLALAGILTCAIASGVSPRSAPVNVSGGSKNGSTRPQASKPLEFKDSAGRYSATLRVGPMLALQRGKAERFWGSFGPKSLVAYDLNIRHGKESVYVPISCYADLAEVNSFHLESTRKGCKVLIVGGDASTAYTASIVVTGLFVTSRVLRETEFPEYHYETATYVSLAPPE